MQCPCRSGQLYSTCCGRFIQQSEIPSCPQSLMRSRYTAFALADGQYLFDSWHESTRPDLGSLDLTDDPQHWIGLQILGHKLSDEQHGEVEFIAYSCVGGALYQLRERSDFVCEQGKWYYVSGDIHPQSGKIKNAANLPCPCLSGKKFKKCCARLD